MEDRILHAEEGISVTILSAISKCGEGGRAFDVAESANKGWVPRPSRTFAKGGSYERVHECGVFRTDEILSAASPPTLAKNARMGHPSLYVQEGGLRSPLAPHLKGWHKKLALRHSRVPVGARPTLPYPCPALQSAGSVCAKSQPIIIIARLLYLRAWSLERFQVYSLVRSRHGYLISPFSIRSFAVGPWPLPCRKWTVRCPYQLSFAAKVSYSPSPDDSSTPAQFGTGKPAAMSYLETHSRRLRTCRSPVAGTCRSFPADRTHCRLRGPSSRSTRKVFVHRRVRRRRSREALLSRGRTSPPPIRPLEAKMNRSRMYGRLRTRNRHSRYTNGLSPM